MYDVPIYASNPNKMTHDTSTNISIVDADKHSKFNMYEHARTKFFLRKYVPEDNEN